MTMTDEKTPGGPSGQDLVEQLKAAGQLDALFAQIDAGEVELTGMVGSCLRWSRPRWNGACRRS